MRVSVAPQDVSVKLSSVCVFPRLARLATNVDDGEGQPSDASELIAPTRAQATAQVLQVLQSAPRCGVRFRVASVVMRSANHVLGSSSASALGTNSERLSCLITDFELSYHTDSVSQPREQSGEGDTTAIDTRLNGGISLGCFEISSQELHEVPLVSVRGISVALAATPLCDQSSCFIGGAASAIFSVTKLHVWVSTRAFEVLAESEMTGWSSVRGPQKLSRSEHQQFKSSLMALYLSIVHSVRVECNIHDAAVRVYEFEGPVNAIPSSARALQSWSQHSPQQAPGGAASPAHRVFVELRVRQAASTVLISPAAVSQRCQTAVSTIEVMRQLLSHAHASLRLAAGRVNMPLLVSSGFPRDGDARVFLAAGSVVVLPAVKMDLLPEGAPDTGPSKFALTCGIESPMIVYCHEIHSLLAQAEAVLAAFKQPTFVTPASELASLNPRSTTTPPMTPPRSRASSLEARRPSGLTIDSQVKEDSSPNLFSLPATNFRFVISHPRFVYVQPNPSHSLGAHAWLNIHSSSAALFFGSDPVQMESTSSYNAANPASLNLDRLFTFRQLAFEINSRNGDGALETVEFFRAEEAFYGFAAANGQSPGRVYLDATNALTRVSTQSLIRAQDAINSLDDQIDEIESRKSFAFVVAQSSVSAMIHSLASARPQPPHSASPTPRRSSSSTVLPSPRYGRPAVSGFVKPRNKTTILIIRKWNWALTLGESSKSCSLGLDFGEFRWERADGVITDSHHSALYAKSYHFLNISATFQSHNIVSCDRADVRLVEPPHVTPSFIPPPPSANGHSAPLGVADIYLVTFWNFHFRLPWAVRVGNCIEELLLAWKLYNLSRGKRGDDPSTFQMDFNGFTFDIIDSDWHARLIYNLHAARDENQKRLIRDELLAKKLHGTKITPSQLEDLRQKLSEKGSADYVTRLKQKPSHAYPPLLRTRVESMSLAFVPFGSRSAEAMFVARMDPEKARPPLYECDSWEILATLHTVTHTLRDFPVPLLSLSHIRLLTPFILASDERGMGTTSWKCSGAKRECEYHTFLLPSVKFFDCVVEIGEMFVCYGRNYESALTDVGHAWTFLTPEAILPSHLEWFDSLRVHLFASTTCAVSSLDLRLPSSLSPYDVTEFVSIRQSDIKFLARRSGLQYHAAALTAVLSVNFGRARQETQFLEVSNFNLAIETKWNLKRSKKESEEAKVNQVDFCHFLIEQSRTNDAEISLTVSMTPTKKNSRLTLDPSCARRLQEFARIYFFPRVMVRGHGLSKPTVQRSLGSLFSKFGLSFEFANFELLLWQRYLDTSDVGLLCHCPHFSFSTVRVLNTMKNAHVAVKASASVRSLHCSFLTPAPPSHSNAQEQPLSQLFLAAGGVTYTQKFAFFSETDSVTDYPTSTAAEQSRFKHSLILDFVRMSWNQNSRNYFVSWVLNLADALLSDTDALAPSSMNSQQQQLQQQPYVSASSSNSSSSPAPLLRSRSTMASSPSRPPLPKPPSSEQRKAFNYDRPFFRHIFLIEFRHISLDLFWNPAMGHMILVAENGFVDVRSKMEQDVSISSPSASPLGLGASPSQASPPSTPTAAENAPVSVIATAGLQRYTLSNIELYMTSLPVNPSQFFDFRLKPSQLASARRVGGQTSMVARCEYPKSKSLRSSSQLHVSFERLDLEMRAVHYHLFLEIISQLVLDRVPTTAAEEDNLEALQYKTQLQPIKVSDIHGLQQRVKVWKADIAAMQDLIEALERVHTTHTSNEGDSDSLPSHDAEIAALSDKIEHRKDRLNTARTTLALLERAERQKHHQAALGGEGERRATWVSTYSVGTGIWVMLGDDDVPFCEWKLSGFKGIVLDYHAEDVTSLHIAFTDLEIFSKIPNTVYPRVLARQEQSTAGLAFEVQAQRSANVGGIPVYDDIQMRTVPLRIQMQNEIFNRCRRFFFLSDVSEVELQSQPQQPQLEASDVASTHPSHSTHTPALLMSSHLAHLANEIDSDGLSRASPGIDEEPHRDSPSHSQATSSQQTTLTPIAPKKRPGHRRRVSENEKKDHFLDLNDAVAVMRARASTTVALAKVQIAPLRLSISYKSGEKDSMLDVDGLQLVTKPIAIENQMLTWEALFEQVKKDVLRDIVAQVFFRKRVDPPDDRSRGQGPVAGPVPTVVVTAPTPETAAEAERRKRRMQVQAQF
eukprot:TRINITY_DN6790_c0_g1_i2.p1 TRINITY_DN6790_c0_g1~~TRINITY_DN6790_c0_g1_i2.p1  ORF type:complete len:2159 (+),score=416.88 TRINITY_DN6790_c0_g1_i2:908-7384(+)